MKPIAHLTLVAGMALSASAAEFHVAPNGDDANPGTQESPFRTLVRAQQAARTSLRHSPMVVLHEGTYALDQALVFGAEDSGATWTAAPGEHPVLSGGIAITGWTADGQGRFKATVPEGLDNFRQLWVDGKRATRPRAPVLAGMKQWGKMKATAKLDPGFPELAATPEYAPATLERIEPAGYTSTDASAANWKNIGDVELGYLFTFEHHIAKVESISRTSDGVSIEMAQPGFFLSFSKYKNADTEEHTTPLPTYIENVFECLSKPGEFYLDRPAREVYYIPRPGEDLSKVVAVAPKLETMVKVHGARDVKFRGITFSHATWHQPSTAIGLPEIQASISAMPNRSFFRKDVKDWWHPHHQEGQMSVGNVLLDDCRGVRFDRCVFSALGGSGLSIQNASQYNTVSGCRFEDISANGILVGGVAKEDHHPSDPHRVTKGNRIENSLITRAGAEYTGSVGIFYGYTEGTVIEHNELHDLPYSAVSGGWGWGITDVGGGRYRWPPVYQTPTTCRNNRMEYNRMYNIMKCHIDGGAVYLLSRQDNTHIRYNYATDTVYPGVFYFDEGSAGSEASFNVVDPGCNPVFDYGRGFGKNNFVRPASGIHGMLLDEKPCVDMAVPAELPQFTISALVFLRSYPGGRDARRWIACKTGHELSNGNLSLIVDGEQLVGSLNLGGGMDNKLEARSSVTVPIQRWTQVTMTSDGAELKVYVDGVEAAVAKPRKPYVPGGGSLAVGKRADNFGYFDCGSMSRFDLYSRVLTCEEMKKNLSAKGAAVREGLVGEHNFETKSPVPPAPHIDRIVEEAGLQPEFMDITR